LGEGRLGWERVKSLSLVILFTLVIRLCTHPLHTQSAVTQAFYDVLHAIGQRYASDAE